MRHYHLGDKFITSGNNNQVSAHDINSNGLPTAEGPLARALKEADLENKRRNNQLVKLEIKGKRHKILFGILGALGGAILIWLLSHIKEISTFLK